MERKKKIEMVRRARQQAAAAAEAEAATSETEAPRHAETEDSAQKVDGQQDDLSGKSGNTENLFMSQIYPDATRIMLIIIIPFFVWS
jgi:phage/plasmid primase-like uncharacterized protein